jgi:hypothetical protein
MADNNKLELVVDVDVNKANASIKSFNTGLSSMEHPASKAWGQVLGHRGGAGPLGAGELARIGKPPCAVNTDVFEFLNRSATRRFNGSLLLKSSPVLSKCGDDSERVIASADLKCLGHRLSGLHVFGDQSCVQRLNALELVNCG